MIRLKFNLSECVKKALIRTNEAGEEAFIVGGCVRDILMGKTPHDWDVTTSAKPEKTKEIFSSFKTVDTGIRHGTVLVLIDGEPLEITTYRIDGEYTDCRHPDSVKFTSDIENDLSRRDFTVNAMAYNDEKGLVDLFGGEDDIRNKIIRCVGDADKRFNEDALRIMRALRFSSTLGFTIESETKKAILKNKELLNNVARERISTELLKLLCGKNAFNVLEEFEEVFGVIIPELKSEFGFEQYGEKHAYTVWGHTCHTVDNIDSTDEILRLTMLLHDIGKPATHKLNDKGESTFKNHAAVGGEIAERVLKDLRFSNKVCETVTFLVSHHDMEVPSTRAEVKRYLNMMGEENFVRLMKIRTADRGALSENFRDICAQTDFAYAQFYDIIDKKEPYALKDLAVNGCDLKKIGITGEKTREVLEKLLCTVIENPEMNTKEKLTALITDC